MSIFNRWKQPQPPPPIYKRQPAATAAVILTLVGMFVLGPVGYLWNGMAEEMKAVKAKVEEVQKEKATNEDVKAALEELKAQRKDQAVADKEQNDKLQTNQLAIKEILTRQEMITAPGGFKFRKKETPKDSPKIEASKDVFFMKKKPIPPDYFVKIQAIENPEARANYLKYLKHKGYDIEGLE